MSTEKGPTAVQAASTAGDAHGKKKQNHHKRRKKPTAAAPGTNGTQHVQESEATTNPLVSNVEIEYVVEKPADVAPELGEVFNRLARIKPEGAGGVAGENNDNVIDSAVDGILDSVVADMDDSNKQSKREYKKKSRPTVAQLKQIVPRPAVVEVHDVTSPDPELLVFLKSRRMAVPVPRHWISSSRFLSGKRASDRKPYQLPDYIANTGIGKLREASDDANDSMQKRTRERARPKLGQIEIDYQVLYDAFFKYQTKPKLTQHGELFHEGKDSEKDFSRFVAGVISDELRTALGMPTVEREGKQAAEQHAPPWIHNMQRYGPPPSYPGVKYPGVNAPLPSGAQYGMQPGGWGKPPLDQLGRGLYGDVLGTATAIVDSAVDDRPIKLWGDFQVFDEEEEESTAKRQRFEEEEEEEEPVQEPTTDVSTTVPVFAPPLAPKTEKNLVPEEIVDLRKKPTQPLPQKAYKVLEKEAVSLSGGNELFGAAHKYALNADRGVAVAIVPDQLQEGGPDKEELAKLYEDERMRTKPAMGLAPGAGHVNLAEIEQQTLAKKSKEKEKKDKKKSLKGYEF